MEAISLVFLILVAVIYVVLALVISGIIKNDSVDRNPFLWLLFFSPILGTIIYTQLVNNDLLEEAVKRLEK